MRRLLTAPYRTVFACLLLASASAAAQDTATTPANTATPATPATVAAPASTTAAHEPITCVEVERFQVSDDEKVEGQTERAATIPERNLEIIQDRLAKHLPTEARGIAAHVSGTSSCPNPASAAVLSGDILDFRKGNMALRYLVGFGAGSQKVRVRLTLKRKGDGSTLTQTEIADTKWGGAFGGTNTKGLDDFAEKAAEAAAKALRGH